ncbi:hypothetical protein Drorol1_Dr00000588 [Drosera rotundifolia]
MKDPSTTDSDYSEYARKRARAKKRGCEWLPFIQVSNTLKSSPVGCVFSSDQWEWLQSLGKNVRRAIDDLIDASILQGRCRDVKVGSSSSELPEAGCSSERDEESMGIDAELSFCTTVALVARWSSILVLGFVMEFQVLDS